MSKIILPRVLNTKKAEKSLIAPNDSTDRSALFKGSYMLCTSLSEVVVQFENGG